MWGEWYAACRKEIPQLLDLADSVIRLMGVNYRGTHKNELAFLNEFGDPFAANIFDPKGKLGFELGVIGAPETFVVDAQSVIRYHHKGHVSPEDVRSCLLPEVEKVVLIRLLGLVLLMIFIAQPAWSAGIELREFDDPVTEQRYRDLTASMRCPLCENQATDDSDAPISADMRERVYQLLDEGKSDTEIIHHMVQRFGDYVLYNPRLEQRTYLLLWGLW